MSWGIDARGVVGGPADKAGIRYEDWWTALRVAEILRGEVLEVPSAQWTALDVDAWAEHHGDTEGRSLACHGRADAVREFRVQGGAEGDGGREAGGREAVARDDSLDGIASRTLDPVGAVREVSARTTSRTGVVVQRLPPEVSAACSAGERAAPGMPEVRS